MDNWKAKDVARLLSLVEAERRYFQDMVSALPMALAVVAEDVSLVTANRAFRKLFGLSHAAEETRSLEEAVPIDGLRDALTAIVTGGAPHSWVAGNVATPSGPRTLQVSLEPYLDWDDTAAPQALVLIEDYTDAVADAKTDAEAAGVAVGKRLDALPAVAWRLDPSTMRFTEVSQEPVSRLRLPAEHWRPGAEFWSGRIHPADLVRLRGLHQVALGGGPLDSCDYRAIAASGETRWLRDLLRFHRDPDGNVTLIDGITLDITASRRRAESHHQARKTEALTRLAARIVHEGNNLLTILSGYGEDLLHSLPEDNALRVNVQEILHAGDRLSTLLAQLGPATARPKLQRQTFSVDTFLAGLRESLQPALPAGIELILDLQAPKATLDIDPERFGELIGTLVRRACEAIPRGGVITFSSRIEMVRDAAPAGESAMEPGAAVVVRVADNGLAISPAALERIFEPAQSAEEARANLASLYLTTIDNNGDIEVASDHERGTCFTITFPEATFIEVPADAAVQAAPATAPKPPASRSEVVLVVEDEQGIRTLIRKTLQRSGFEVLEAANGQEALKLARSHDGPVHLLLTDVVMPEMGGVELARELAPLRRGLKVLFISGYTGPAGVDTSGLPATAFLQKPFTLAALLAKVKELLASKESSRASG